MTLGELLRLEREKRGFTIEQVASSTKIGIRILHALEADHFSDLPAKPFIRGFINSYCRFIGIDSREVLSNYDAFIDEKVLDRPNRDGGHSGYAFEKKDGQQQSRTFLTIAICSFIVMGGVAMLIFKPSLHGHKKSHLEKLRLANPSIPLTVPLLNSTPTSVPSLAVNTELPVPQTAASLLAIGSITPLGVASLSPVAATPSVAPSPLPSPSHSSSTTALLQHDPADPLDSGLPLKGGEIRHKVVFNIERDVWVRYQVDDRPVRKFVIRKGKALVLRAKTTIRLQVSDPQAILFNYNNKGYKLLAEEQKATKRGGNFTLFFPQELAETIEKPFGDVQPLPLQVSP